MEEKKLKLLFIDDEKDYLDICRKYFTMKNIQVFTALNGLDGLALAKTEKPDLIVLDVRMPGLDGIKVLKELRSFDQHVKVIILSGFGTNHNVLEASKLAVSDFLNKPFVLSTLQKVIEEAIANKVPSD